MNWKVSEWISFLVRTFFSRLMRLFSLLFIATVFLWPFRLFFLIHLLFRASVWLIGEHWFSLIELFCWAIYEVPKHCEHWQLIHSEKAWILHETLWQSRHSSSFLYQIFNQNVNLVTQSATQPKRNGMHGTFVYCLECHISGTRMQVCSPNRPISSVIPTENEKNLSNLCAE